MEWEDEEIKTLEWDGEEVKAYGWDGEEVKAYGEDGEEVKAHGKDGEDKSEMGESKGWKRGSKDMGSTCAHLNAHLLQTRVVPAHLGTSHCTS